MGTDLFDQAMEKREGKRVAEVGFDLWSAVWESGQGPRPFDAQVDDPGKGLIVVTMDFTTLNGKTFSFEHITDWPDWQTVTLPSIMALNIDGATSPGDKLRAMGGQWVEYEIVEREYTKKDGTKGKGLAVKFLNFLGDRAAAEAYVKGSDDTPEPTNGNGDDPQKAVAAQFIGPLWAQASGDVSKLGQLLASNPLTSKYFTVNSPEVVAVVGGAE
jgi:hypothetical protein